MGLLLLKVIRNKRNNQLFIHLSRKKLGLLNKNPEYLDLKRSKLIFLKKKIKQKKEGSL